MPLFLNSHLFDTGNVGYEPQVVEEFARAVAFGSSMGNPNDFLLEHAKHDDAGKTRYELIPPQAIEELAKVYTFGTKKYGDRDWEKGTSWGKFFGSMLRHAWIWWRRESLDPESKCHHLAHVAWNAFALMEYEWKQKGIDDRPERL